jgi:ribose/xylose/arabinose/galactoside ABC-type transport system permease subunit
MTGIMARLNRAGLIRSSGLLVALALMFLVLELRAPDFYSLSNVKTIGEQMAETGIVASGTAMLMISGNIDLSIGSLLSLCAVVSALAAAPLGWPVAFLVGIALATVIGLVNGAVVWRIRVSPLIVTLGALTAYAGVADLFGNDSGLLNVPASFAKVGNMNPLGLPVAVWVMLVAFVVVHIIMQHTVAGRHIYAIGGNKEAATVAGIRVRRITLALFAFNGFLVGIAAVLTASRFGTASPNFGTGFELQVITAVIIGGVAFSGGEGTAFGVFLGVLLLTIISTGLVALNVNPFYTNIVQGAVLVAAVAIDQIVQERREHHRKAVAMIQALRDDDRARARNRDGDLRASG